MDYLDRSFQSVAKAIQHFSCLYDNICYPLKPEFSFDLLGVNADKIDRIKVFRTECILPSGSYSVNLRKSGGYKNSSEHKQPFDPSICDVVFIESPEGIYVIPSAKITQTRALTLSMYPQYLVPS